MNSNLFNNNLNANTKALNLPVNINNSNLNNNIEVNSRFSVTKDNASNNRFSNNNNLLNNTENNNNKINLVNTNFFDKTKNNNIVNNNNNNNNVVNNPTPSPNPVVPLNNSLTNISKPINNFQNNTNNNINLINKNSQEDANNNKNISNLITKSDNLNKNSSLELTNFNKPTVNNNLELQKNQLITNKNYFESETNKIIKNELSNEKPNSVINNTTINKSDFFNEDSEPKTNNEKAITQKESKSLSETFTAEELSDIKSYIKQHDNSKSQFQNHIEDLYQYIITVVNEIINDYNAINNKLKDIHNTYNIQNITNIKSEIKLQKDLIKKISILENSLANNTPLDMNIVGNVINYIERYNCDIGKVYNNNFVIGDKDYYNIMDFLIKYIN